MWNSNSWFEESFRLIYYAWFITSSIVGTNIYAMETIEHQGIRVNWTVFNVALSSPAGTSGIVMTSIPSPTSAFSCWNAIWLEPNSWFRIGFLSCDEHMTRMTRKSTSGIVGSGHSSANIPFFHQPHRHREGDLIGFFGIHVDHHLAQILPRREQKAK